MVFCYGSLSSPAHYRSKQPSPFVVGSANDNDNSNNIIALPFSDHLLCDHFSFDSFLLYCGCICFHVLWRLEPQSVGRLAYHHEDSMPCSGRLAQCHLAEASDRNLRCSLSFIYFLSLWICINLTDYICFTSESGACENALGKS